MIDIKDKLLENFTFIDLFAGLGGFRLALESLGAKCVFTSEWEKSVSKIYKDNFSCDINGDITKINEKDIPNFDILCAGFPCQSFSISGKQLGFKDTRGTLFFDVARIVKEKKPKVVFMENVKNFATHDDGNTLKVVKSTMEEMGYTFFYKVLDSSNYGVPQKRERIYMVCFRKDLNVKNFSFPKGFDLKKHVEDFLIKDEALLKNFYVERKDLYLKDIKDDTYSDKPIRLGIVNKGGQGERIYSIKGVAITFSSMGGGAFARTGGYLINGKTRRLHPRECARLMGYPDTYKIDNNTNRAFKHLGNSVVIDVLQYIAIEFAKELKKEP